MRTIATSNMEHPRNINDLLSEITEGAKRLERLAGMSNEEFVEYMKKEWRDKQLSEMTGLPIKIHHE